MRDIYELHFRVSTGPLMAEVERIKAVNKAGRDEYIKIAEEIGASTDSIMMTNGHYLSGFKFDLSNAPDPKLYKQQGDPSTWYPKKNNKVGRALHKRIEAVITENPADALDIIGLGKRHERAIFGDNYVYWVSLVTIPSSPPVH